jgi:hypothetical protein
MLSTEPGLGPKFKLAPELILIAVFRNCRDMSLRKSITILVFLTISVLDQLLTSLALAVL